MSYEYLASPYTHPDAARRALRCKEAERASAFLIMQRRWVYSPIMHCHYMSLDFKFPYVFEFWNDYNEKMILRSNGVIVLQIEGWEQSRGVKSEMEFCMRLGLPITFMLPEANGNYILS